MSTRKKLLITYIIFVMVPLILFYFGIQWFVSNAKKEFENRIDEFEVNQEFEIRARDESMLQMAMDGLLVDGVLDDDEVKTLRNFLSRIYRQNLQLKLEGDIVFQTLDYEAAMMDEDSIYYTGHLTTVEGYEVEYTTIRDESLKIAPPYDFFRNIGNRVILFIILAYILINILFMQYAFRHVFSPLTELIKVAESIKRGKFNYPIENNRSDEIGDVFDAFSEMQDELGKAKEVQEQYESNRKELIANISHDLKTPIAAINGYINGIADGVADTPEKLDRYTSIIKGYVKEMDLLINDLTTLSQFDVDQMQFAFEPVNINSYLEDCVEELNFEMIEREIKLDYSSDVANECQVKVDRDKLKRVINNIVFNAMKHYDKDRKSLGICLLDEGDYCHISIKDNGCGIPDDKVDRIFERFFRVDEARNRAGGNGLGLSIAKHIVQSHGGDIWAASEEGVGTTIHFTIRKW